METRLKNPVNPPFVEGYAKGLLSQVEHYTKAKLQTEISDDFEDGLDNWINVKGELLTISGNLAAPTFGYAAGYHRTTLLSDNCRAKITVQDGFISAGKACVVICADARMDFYYGLMIETGILNNKFHIVRGTGTKSREVLVSASVEIDPDDTAEIWYDQPNSTLRAYYNGSQVASVVVERNDIPHGPGRRFAGAIMGIDWFVAPGVLFEDFEAWDVNTPDPFIRDGFDSLTVDADWAVLDNGVKIHQHLTRPNTIGPNNALYSDAAILHATEASQDSVKIVVRTHNFGGGKYTIALCSNAAMTDWMGVQWDTGIFNRVLTVRGSGPTDYTEIGDTEWSLSESGTVFVVTYNYTTNVLRLYRNTETAPLLEWTGITGVTHGSGQRYVGMVWETDLPTTGPQPSMFEAYNVTANAPLPA